MQNRTVLFLGAGFSVAAKIPVQNRILYEMIKESTEDSSTMLIKPENIKFLNAYIEVGLFLLEKFTNENVVAIRNKLSEVKFLRGIIETFENLNNPEKAKTLYAISKALSDDSVEKDFINMLLAPERDTTFDKIIAAKYYKTLIELKEGIRELLANANANIDLEDLFTIFDKSLRENENWDEFTYIELDKLRHSLLRLFTYYFGVQINKFRTNKTQSYDGFNKFCQMNSIGIVTTNWDTVVEMLFKKYGLGFQTNIESYLSKTINICKLHGSINWFKCNCCGEYQVAEYSEIAKHLLDDDKPEVCSRCNNKAHSNQVVLQPEIITPTMLKTLNNKLFREIWTDAANEIEKADRVIFIGYSLPLADFEIRYILRKHIKKDTIIEVVLAKNDCPKNNKELSVKPEGRFRTLFPSNNIVFHYNGFTSFFDQENQKLV